MKIRFIKYLFLASIFFSSHVYAAVKTFTGTGNWNSTNAWTPNGTPSSSDDVVIPTGKSPNVNISNGQCRSLTIQTGATLSIGNSKSLTVNKVFE